LQWFLKRRFFWPAKAAVNQMIIDEIHYQYVYEYKQRISLTGKDVNIILNCIDIFDISTAGLLQFSKEKKSIEARC
jgi:hypothetical protein